MKTKTKLWLAVSLGLLLVVGALVAIKAGQIGKMINAGKSFTPPPESVATAKVQESEWEGSTDVVGTIVAVRGVVLGAELSGIVRQIDFESGSNVKRGDVLVKLDTSTEEAQLAAARADASLAKVNLDRARRLREAGSNSVADLDAAEARSKAAAANVASLEATIAKKTIRAPFDGRIAIRQVELGQVVSNGTPIASLQSVTPIYAEFTLPQQALADVKAGQKAQLRTDTFPGRTWQGEVSVVNPEVDMATRNVRIRALFPNQDGKLRPGMFARVEVLSGEHRDVLIIPTTAVVYAPYGDSVFVVDEQKDQGGKTTLTVKQRFVRVGERRGDFIAVQSGLKVGETVVSAGAFKLRPGMAVAVNNELAPQPQLSPKPVEQ
ncbi:MAG TPA: efflux RND transporter periplasmic adaptor subunit [Anaeromyxobacteraceae bacterium]|nr:efflux RND transporter periplasmic adaptor subunit [Anaeromyxobacteraceae bacterium]